MKPIIADRTRQSPEARADTFGSLGARQPFAGHAAVLARHQHRQCRACRPWRRRSPPRSRQVQWIVLAYLLAITTLIVSVGRLGDIVGRRRLLLAGIALFTAASVLCGVAPTLWLLIAARAAQGLGAAVMMALTMALVGETVPKARTGSAMGLLGTMSAIGTALGPSLGGVLIAGPGWRAIFLVNLPLGLLALRSRLSLPARRSPAADRPIGPASTMWARCCLP